jgi:glycosyltransferase involved in cell wall biosynthesis
MISAIVVCMNEEANIAACLESVRWCDEVVVIDSFSTDRTVEIARSHADLVIERPWPGMAAQKQFALEQAKGEWILSLDADERCTPQLRAAIGDALANPGQAAGFEMKRHVFYLGRWIDHGGWYPDWKLRLARRDRARFTGHGPHDRLEVDGPTQRLDAELVHYTYRNFSQHLRTVDRFSDVFAQEWLAAGRRFSLLDALFHPPLKFLDCYVWKRGFLDGWAGFVIALTSAFYVFAKQVKLREKTRDARSEASGGGASRIP